MHFYTREFYQTVRSHLHPNGIVAQWMPIYNLTTTEAAGVVRTFVSVFPQATLWYNRANLLLLGFNGDLTIDVNRVDRWLQREEISSDLNVSYVDSATSSLNRLEPFLAGFLMGPEELARFSDDGQLYTDDRPELEFTWTEFPVWGTERKDSLILRNIERIEQHLGEVGAVVVGEADRPAVEEIRATRRSYINQLRAAALDNLGNHYLSRGIIDQALAQYQMAIRTQPRFAQAHNNLGSLYLRMGRVPDALSAYGEAIRIDPDFAEAHYNVGTLYTRLGRTAEALAAYREAIRARPDFAFAHNAVGGIYAQLPSVEEAERAYREAIRSDPTYADAYVGLALLLANSGEMDRAAQTVGELLEKVPNEPRAHQLKEQFGQTTQGSR